MEKVKLLLLDALASCNYAGNTQKLNLKINVELSTIVLNVTQFVVDIGESHPTVASAIYSTSDLFLFVAINLFIATAAYINSTAKFKIRLFKSFDSHIYSKLAD